MGSDFYISTFLYRMVRRHAYDHEDSLTGQGQRRHLLAQRRKPRRIRQPPDPDVLTQEIVDDLEAALEQFREIAADLGGERIETEKT